MKTIGEYKELEQIACDYHYHTEHHDRLFCTGEMRHGSVMPHTAEENRKIQVNARNERLVAIKKGGELGFSFKEVEKAISDYAAFFDYEREKEIRSRNNPKIINHI